MSADASPRYVAAVTADDGTVVCTGNVRFVDQVTGATLGTVTATGYAGACRFTLAVGDATGRAVLARFLGTSAFAPSVSDPVVAPVPTVVLTVTPTTGPGYQDVTMTAAVPARTTGSVCFYRDELGVRSLLGRVPLPAGHPLATLVTNALGPGTHVLVAATCTSYGVALVESDEVVVTYRDPKGSEPDEQFVTVAIPVGMLSITSPYTPESPLDLGVAVLDQATSTYGTSAVFQGIAITDTRAGEPGFTASVGATPLAGPGSIDARHLGLVDLTAHQVPDNAMQAADVELMDVPALSPGLASSHVIARYPASRALGTVGLAAVLVLEAVPSSTPPGTYTATVTFTAW